MGGLAYGRPADGGTATARPDARAPEATRAPRQWLSDQQQATVEALLDAGRDLLRTTGFDDVSLRDVARHAGVTHTTAYTYFSSKAHLVAEIHWRMVVGLPAPATTPTDDVATRVRAALRDLAAPYGDEPGLAQGILASMVSRDPDTARVRDAIGAEIAARIGAALGADHDPRIVESTLMLFSGAMLQAGLGHRTFDEVVERTTEAVAMWTDPR